MGVKKHAYLIMAHHKLEILEQLLLDLDDQENDIFLHVDIKNKEFSPEWAKSCIKNADLMITERKDVHWGGFSQIDCILMLLKAARTYGDHVYYHFMVGVEFPLRSQKYIHDFFHENQGKEFIGFCDEDRTYMERVRYYHPFNEYARNNNVWQKILNKIRIATVGIEKIVKIDISKKYGLSFRKGNANWSITEGLVDDILSNEEQIRKIYKHSWCGDEVFVHTLVFNSDHWEDVYDQKDEYHSSMRITTWEDPDNRYHLDDLDMLLRSGRLFARKIDGEDALELIEQIRTKRDEGTDCRLLCDQGEKNNII